MDLLIITLIYLFLCLIELFFAYLEKDLYRKIFKCLPLLSLFLFSIITNTNDPLLYIPFLLYAIGDAFLISMKKIYFIIGTISFLVGHILIAIKINLLNINFEAMPYLILMQVGIIIGGIVMAFNILKKQLKENTLPGGVYLGTLISNSILSIISIIILNNYYFIFLSIGFFIYFFSDLLVLKKRFINRFKRDDFFIMASYYLAVMLVFIGYMMM